MFFIYEVNYFIKIFKKNFCFIAPLKEYFFYFRCKLLQFFFKKMCFKNGLKTGRFVCIYIRMCICMYVCMYVLYIRIYIYSMYVHTYIRMYVCIIRMYVCMYVCMHVCMYVCIYIHKHTGTYHPSASVHRDDDVSCAL